MVLQVFGLAMAMPTVHTDFQPTTKKIILTRGLTFLQRSYGEYSKVEKPALVSMSYEGPDDDEELKMVPIIS